jgi:hypothetical protein
MIATCNPRLPSLLNMNIVQHRTLRENVTNALSESVALMTHVLYTTVVIIALKLKEFVFCISIANTIMSLLE